MTKILKITRCGMCPWFRERDDVTQMPDRCANNPYPKAIEDWKSLPAWCPLEDYKEETK